LEWPGKAQVFRLERTLHDRCKRELRHEVVYGLTSLPAAKAGPPQLLDLVRLH